MKRLFVVDDDVVLLSLIRVYFSEEGFEVFTESNSKKAISRMRKIRPDFILVDLEMPGANGEDVIAKLRKDAVLRSTPILLISSSFSLKAVARKHDVPFMRKPFALSSLHNAINRLI